MGIAKEEGKTVALDKRCKGSRPNRFESAGSNEGTTLTDLFYSCFLNEDDQ
jgi:hypothetical protein